MPPLRPAPSLIVQYVQTFDSGPAGVADRSLTVLFRAFPKNDHLEHVLLKVIALNALYGTYIWNASPVAEHILRHKIDEKLAQGVPELVNELALVEVKGKIRRNYSFASKYCSWHMPDAYPICDSVVDNLLWEYQRLDRFSDYRRGDLWNDYSSYKRAIEDFRKHYGLTDFSFKELDKFLWSYGKDYYSQAEVASVEVDQVLPDNAIRGVSPTMAAIFDNDEQGYLEWIAVNPYGYVVNAPKRPGVVPYFLHRANCAHVSTSRHTNYTTSDYKKICSLDKQELTLWCDENSIKFRECQHCRP